MRLWVGIVRVFTVAAIVFAMPTLADDLPVSKTTAKTSDPNSLQVQLYNYLFNWALVADGPRSVKLSPAALRHGSVVSGTATLYHRIVSINDGKNQVQVNYDLERDPSQSTGFREDYSITVKLESWDLSPSMDPDSAQAILYQVLPPTPDAREVHELSDRGGSDISCYSDREKFSHHQRFWCSFTFAE